ncbi:MAG: S9 family peptidase, partial [Bacteroidota bacterium]
ANLAEALGARAKLSGSNGPRSVNWIDGGSRLSYTAGSGNIVSFDPNKKTENVILDPTNLKTQDGEKFKYRSFQWSDDSKYLIFQSNFRPIWRRSGISDYYQYSIKDQRLQLIAKDAQTAELSPNGKKVAYERGGDMYMFDLASKKEFRLTKDAQTDFYNGRFGWVYEEEFGLAQAWDWSPDSKYIAFWQSDEREVPVFQMTDYQDVRKEWVKVKYPQVGETNPIVKIGVIDTETKSKQWLDLDMEDGYVPRIYWTSKPGQLAVVHLNRAQNHLKLFFFDVKTGKGKLIMDEKNEAWVDVFDFFAGVNHLFFFPEDSEEFIWVSDRDGWSHMYRYDYDGNLINQITQGEWEVVIVHHVDYKKEQIYYTSTEDSPLERNLYVTDFKGKKKEKLTQVAGRHFINFSPNGGYYLDRYSNIATPTQVELWNPSGKMLHRFEDNQQVKKYTESHFYAPKELMEITTSDGQKLDIYLIKPANFDKNKSYPLLLNIYGGPGAQSVYNQFGNNSWEQYLAQEGYVIASVNNRGSGGYGSKFEKIVYKELGKWEAKDFAETAQALAKFSWIDGDRMAIRGHSYGGYMASLTVLLHPDVFKVSLVGAPVTDWRLYDSIYSERYMGLLSDNESNYIKTAPVSHANKLKAKMFLAHSTMDENVHVQNTMQLVKAFIDAGKDVDLRIYPPGAHGVAYNWPSYNLLYQQYTDYLNQYLK